MRKLSFKKVIDVPKVTETAKAKAGFKPRYSGSLACVPVH